MRLVTLSNGSTDVAERLLSRAGVLGEFERLMSVADAPAWKPARAAYEYAARACGTDVSRMLLVAVHPWDIPGARWADLDWIRELRDGPILVKGVMRPEEAVLAADHGLAGVIVSNHGGRQLDHQPATIDVLPGILDAAGGRLEVLVDSGFRRGSDIAAALALGARAVLVGRAHLHGLAAAGEAGVRHCIDILAGELRRTMQLAGARSIAELDRHLIRRRQPA